MVLTRKILVAKNLSCRWGLTVTEFLAPGWFWQEKFLSPRIFPAAEALRWRNSWHPGGSDRKNSCRQESFLPLRAQRRPTLRPCFDFLRR